MFPNVAFGEEFFSLLKTVYLTISNYVVWFNKKQTQINILLIDIFINYSDYYVQISHYEVNPVNIFFICVVNIRWVNIEILYIFLVMMHFIIIQRSLYP